jgi:hypothetical protein
MMKKLYLGLVTLVTALTALGGGNQKCFDFIPPGVWTITSVSGNNFLRISDGMNYSIEGAVLAHVQPDSTGVWDSFEVYTGGVFYLTNKPSGGSQTSSKKPQVHAYPISQLVIEIRNSRFAETNSTYIEFLAIGETAHFVYTASYAGSPSVVNVAETPDTIGYTITSAPLAQASICFGHQGKGGH